MFSFENFRRDRLPNQIWDQQLPSFGKMKPKAYGAH